MLDERMVVVGAAIGFLGGLSYLKATLRGDVHPNRVTWLLWALIPLVAFAASVREGVGLPALTTFMAGFTPLLILAASFAKGRGDWRLTAPDLACGTLSSAGLLLWLTSQVGVEVILFMILADAVAAVPTIAKSIREPEGESPFVYLFGAVNAAITLLAIDKWEFAYYGFPVYMLVLGSVLAILIRFRVGPGIDRRRRPPPSPPAPRTPRVPMRSGVR